MRWCRHYKLFAPAVIAKKVSTWSKLSESIMTMCAKSNSFLLSSGSNQQFQKVCVFEDHVTGWWWCLRSTVFTRLFLESKTYQGIPAVFISKPCAVVCSTAAKREMRIANWKLFNAQMNSRNPTFSVAVLECCLPAIYYFRDNKLGVIARSYTPTDELNRRKKIVPVSLSRHPAVVLD